ncbi:MAG: hypothetical protein GY842_16465 [bacterium]|nr:hypothetical protein [bacterium]
MGKRKHYSFAYCCRLVVGVSVIACLCCPSAGAKDYEFSNITELPGGPGQGNAPSINPSGDIAFHQGTTIHFFDRSAGTFLNVSALPGAPPQAWFPKLNSSGNIAMINPDNRDLWLFEADTQAFTNISALGGYPGNSAAHGLRDVFDLNDHNRVSFHSGDLNFGDIYVYDHAAGTFPKVTDQPGGPTKGRENTINNADQIAYMGFPDIYVYDLGADTTTNVTDLPGGPGTGVSSAISLNDRGDLALVSPTDVVYYEAATSSFLYLATLPGFPAGSSSSSANDLSDRGEITFWRTDQHYYDPLDQSFTKLTDQGPVPDGGMESSIGCIGQIAFAAGYVSVEDIYLAIPLPRGDVDGDSDVDLEDHAAFADCMTGPNDGPPEGACNAFDFEPDHDVDLRDFAVLQAAFAGD